MSWSLTINDLQHVDIDTFWSNAEVLQNIEYFITQHPKYADDLGLALALAKAAGLKSCVLTGMRTPSPYGGDEVVDISVRGMTEATDYQAAVKAHIMAGPILSDESVPPVTVMVVRKESA